MPIQDKKRNIFTSVEIARLSKNDSVSTLTVRTQHFSKSLKIKDLRLGDGIAPLDRCTFMQQFHAEHTRVEECNSAYRRAFHETDTFSSCYRNVGRLGGSRANNGFGASGRIDTVANYGADEQFRRAGFRQRIGRRVIVDVIQDVGKLQCG